MKVIIICKLSEVFILPHITTEKGNVLKFTKGTTEVSINKENLEKLNLFVKYYREFVKIIVGKEADTIDVNKEVIQMNKEQELADKKAKLFTVLEEIKNNLKDYKKEQIIDKFKEFITDENSKKENIIKQIEENIEKLEA